MQRRGSSKRDEVGSDRECVMWEARGGRQPSQATRY